MFKWVALITAHIFIAEKMIVKRMETDCRIQ